MIYFGDPELVERHLHEDLNTIIKNVKIRQEQHLELLQYNKSIAQKKRSIESTIFLNDEITTHNNFLQKVLEVHKKLIKQEEYIIQKYNEASVSFQSVVKLMSRVITRIIETNQTYIEKIKLYDDTAIQNFTKVKNVLKKLINNKNQIDLSLSTKTIIEYSKYKAIHQIQKLKNLIKTLEDGELDKLPFIYKGIKSFQESLQIQAINHEATKIEKRTDKKASPKNEDKHDIINKIKNQLKAQQNQKKQKKTIASKLVSMYSTMDLSKKEFMQEIISSNAKQFERLYGQILSRNKFNQEQILEFQSKKDDFQEKVRNFKEMMIEQSRRIQQVLMIKKPTKVQKKADTQYYSDSSPKIQISIEPIQQHKNPQNTSDQSPVRQFKRTFVLRQKAAQPKYHKETEYIQLRITQNAFNHIRFDSQNQEIFLRSNRNRLPSIQSKQVQSVENQQRYHLSKSKEEKSQVRKNFLMKNIELGVQNVIKHNQQKNQSESKSIAQKLKQLQASTPPNNSVNLMDLSFYGSKKKSFFLGQNRNNYVF